MPPHTHTQSTEPHPDPDPTPPTQPPPHPPNPHLSPFPREPPPPPYAPAPGTPQVLNTVASSLAFFASPDIQGFSRPWYTTGGALIFSIALGDAIFIQVF